jgi:hypothetical protein
MGQVNRPLFLETLQSRLINQSMRINSIRFTNELGTFEYNPGTRKAQAQKGKHDDAIMAMCIALFVRDQMQQDIPMGANMESQQGVGKLSNEVYEEIKRELMDGNPEEILEMSNDMMFDDDDHMSNTEALRFRRKYNNLLKEFGW